MTSLKQKKIPQWTETKMEYAFTAYLPEEYILEPSLRMEIYHRLGNASSLEECAGLEAEIRDRFGPLPSPALWLIHLMRLKAFATLHQFALLHCDKTRVLAKRKAVQKEFPLVAPKDPKTYEHQLVALLQKNFDLSIS